MTIGAAIPAHHVMIRRVYGVADALPTVRLQAGLSEDGITSGNSERKNIATMAAMVTPEKANDQPSRPARFAPSAAASAASATISAGRLRPSPLSTCVQIRKAD